MPVTITLRPEGTRISSIDKSATVTNSSGDALFNSVAHDVGDGFPVYIIGLSERYNGFWEADVIDPDTFKIIDPDTGLPVPFIKSLNVTFNNQIFTHNWSAVHLPIVYKFENDLYPYSQVDGTYDHAIYGFVNGYAAIVDQSTYALGYASLVVGDYIAIYNHDNLFRVVDLVAPNIIVLDWNGDSFANLENTLDPNGTYFNGPFQKYYNNYHVKVQIYAGLTSGHYWAAEKPYELISTIDLVPDNSNKVMFSIAQELMTRIKTLKNNLTLDTLQNNIDAFTMFYITTQEIYDEGNGTEPVVNEEAIVSDQENFEGVAVNAKLEFKNLYSGFMSEYVVIETDQFGLLSIPAQKFLTLFETPTIFSGHYFDLSAIINGVLDPVGNYMVLAVDWLNDDDTVATSDFVGVTANSLGVYRFQIEANCSYNRASIYIYYGQDGYTPDLTERKIVNINCDCANYEIALTWLNYLGGFEYWVFTAQTQHEIDIKERVERTKNIFPEWPKSYGETANTIRQETKRTSTIKKLIRSQPVTEANLEALKYIKTSSLVQIINSQTDLRTVLVDTDSFVVRTDGDKLHYIQFSIEYTDDIPAQRL